MKSRLINSTSIGFSVAASELSAYKTSWLRVTLENSTELVYAFNASKTNEIVLNDPAFVGQKLSAVLVHNQIDLTELLTIDKPVALEISKN